MPEVWQCFWSSTATVRGVPSYWMAEVLWANHVASARKDREVGGKAMSETESKWGICYKQNVFRPATMSGRVLARPETFDTQEETEKFLAEKGENWLYAVQEDKP